VFEFKDEINQDKFEQTKLKIKLLDAKKQSNDCVTWHKVLQGSGRVTCDRSGFVNDINVKFASSFKMIQ